VPANKSAGARVILSLLLTNARSILPKIDNLRGSLSTLAPDIFACTETWLQPNVCDSVISAPSYVIHRSDRPGERRGGGVALFINVKYSSIRLYPTVILNYFDCVWVYIQSLNVIIACVYIPHLSAEQYSNISNCITTSFDQFATSIRKEPSFILCGDFNVFDYGTIVSDLGVKNIVCKATRGDSILDLIFVSNDIIPSSCTIGPPLLSDDKIAVSDHNCVLTELILPLSFSESIGFNTVLDMRERFVNNFVNTIRSFDWANFIDEPGNVKDKAFVFQNFIENSFCSTIPKRIVPISKKDKPWITPYIKSLIHDRWHAYRIRDFQRYNSLSILIKRKILDAKSSWAKRCTKPSDLWNKVHTVLGDKQRDSLSGFLSNFVSSFDAAESLNDAFTSVFINSETVNIPHCNADWNLVISEDEVRDTILKQKVKKSPGSDGLPVTLYHSIVDFICKPLCYLYNLSISTSIFPDCWKFSIVIPLPKCKNPTIQDFRPISLINFFDKIFEKIVYNSLKAELICCFGNEQFGFRPNSSTASAMISLHDFLTRQVDSTIVQGVQVFALDFSKAFDTLRYDVIIDSLIDCNMPLSFVSWVYSYLSNRYQCTRLNHNHSSVTSITSGVPQGSIIGPALFNIVIGKLVAVSNSTGLFKYADDLTLAVPIFLSTNNVTLEIDNVRKFCNDTGLALNLIKCYFIFISFRYNCFPVPVENITERQFLKFLGITLSNDLKWDKHISNICKLANQRFYAIRIVKPYITKLQLITFYNLFIRSILEYCSPIFVGLNVKNCDCLNRVQRRFHNILCFFHCHCDSLDSLTRRRLSASTSLFIFAAKDKTHSLHNKIPQKLRTSFRQPYCRTELRIRSFIPFVTELVNSKLLRTVIV
jgi:hypothetical protein